MGGIGSWEIMALLVIVLLIFGPKNLPRLAKSLGSSVRELKRGVQGLSEDLNDTVNKTDDHQEEKSSARQSDAKPVEKSEDENNG